VHIHAAPNPFPHTSPRGSHLLYVAMTRAMERLHMTHHAGSIFVDRLRVAVGAAA